jgi:hypothetical protein
MKKLMALFVTMLTTLSTYGQNGANEILTPPNSNSPYILVDTLFTLDNFPATHTDVYIHFANPTADNIKAVQFRLFYDNVKFSSAQMFWGPTALSVADKYGSYFNSSNYINVIATYTGNNTSFDWNDGAMFRLRLTHSSAFNGIADSIAIVGSTSYNNLATTGNGVDEPLGMFNYGGNFRMTPLIFPIQVNNADASPAQGVWFTAQKRLKSTPLATWQPITSDSTNSLGQLDIEHPIDTNFWHLRILAQTDTMTDGGSISITDAYKLANAASQQDPLSGTELYAGDINQSQSITVSDAFAVFNRLALQTTTWNSLFSGVNNVVVLWPNEYGNAVTATAVPNWTTLPRRYSIDTIVNGLATINPYIYVVGDATTTGYNNPAVIMARIATPGGGTDYILDPAVYMVNKPDTVQFRIPKLVSTTDNQMRVPVTMYTFGNKIGAAQMGIKFDTNIFRFKSVEVGNSVSKWTSLVSVEEDKVFWAGHEDRMNPSVIEDMTTQFTFVFDILDPLGWTQSPLEIFNKSAGDDNAVDLSIKPSPNDGSVVNKRRLDPSLVEMMESFKVYPNPTSDLTGNWVFIEHYNENENTTLNSFVYDINGRMLKYSTEKIYDAGFQYHGIRMNELPKGIYIVRLITSDRDKFYRIIKN